MWRGFFGCLLFVWVQTATIQTRFLLLKYASPRLIRLVMFRRLAWDWLSEAPVVEQPPFGGNYEPLSKLFSGPLSLRPSNRKKVSCYDEVVEQLSGFSARGWRENLEQKSTESHRAIISISRKWCCSNLTPRINNPKY